MPGAARRADDDHHVSHPQIVDLTREIARRDLAPLVTAIDREGQYPEAVLRALGEAGAFGAHTPGVAAGNPDLKTAIEAMSVVGELCLSTAFCMWCQNALGWYIATSSNTPLQATLGERVSRGLTLGGTGLSNPMKAFAGIERLRLKARRAEGGYIVSGVLPWVSNLGVGHSFGIVFERTDDVQHRVMAVADCSGPGVSIVDNAVFTALNGTRTFCVQFREAFIADDKLLADPIGDYVVRIRAGFILLQAGMAFGLIRDCIGLMQRERPALSHVNRHIEKQPEDFEETLSNLEREVWRLSETPFDPSTEYFRDVLSARLAAGEAAVSAAHYAMLHQGAKGYLADGAAQRRLREAYFVAIVTPATKQLRKMLADLG